MPKPLSLRLLLCFKLPWPCGDLELPWLFKSIRTLAQGRLVAGDLPSPSSGGGGGGGGEEEKEDPRGLVRELEDGAGGWTGFAIADAEDDRWLAECWGRGVAAHWVSAAGSVKPEAGDGRRKAGCGRGAKEMLIGGENGRNSDQVVMEGKGCKGWVLIDLMVNTWWRMCVPNNSSLQFFNIVDHAKTAIDARNKKTV
ncbi:hypothetical protein OsI_36681 [Oryza sativa Indica Group]|uniref:Uncharacterized protein n=1 Tax=Oryza sativa subsp. indica TaxID=39946 RepID=A2ZFX8_ORYSI|nr:hypothetical protein OsI_36681 [Oryza sativa Indica Group]